MMETCNRKIESPHTHRQSNYYQIRVLSPVDRLQSEPGYNYFRYASPVTDVNTIIRSTIYQRLETSPSSIRASSEDRAGWV